MQKWLGKIILSECDKNKHRTFKTEPTYMFMGWGRGGYLMNKYCDKEKTRIKLSEYLNYSKIGVSVLLLLCQQLGISFFIFAK